MALVSETVCTHLVLESVLWGSLISDSLNEESEDYNEKLGCKVGALLMQRLAFRECDSVHSTEDALIMLGYRLWISIFGKTVDSLYGSNEQFILEDKKFLWLVGLCSNFCNSSSCDHPDGHIENCKFISTTSKKRIISTLKFFQGVIHGSILILLPNASIEVKCNVRCSGSVSTIVSFL